jgi:hypothetical protein
VYLKFLTSLYRKFFTPSTPLRTRSQRLAIVEIRVSKIFYILHPKIFTHRVQKFLPLRHPCQHIGRDIGGDSRIQKFVKNFLTFFFRSGTIKLNFSFFSVRPQIRNFLTPLRTPPRTCSRPKILTPPPPLPPYQRVGRGVGRDIGGDSYRKIFPHLSSFF